MSKIRLKQIEESELSQFITTLATGTNFEAALFNYFSQSGFAGPTVVYTTGDQFIQGQKSYSNEMFVPSGGLNLSGVSNKQYVRDHVSGRINSLSGWASSEFISRTLNETVGGIKTFSSNVSLPRASNTGHATNLRDLQIASGVLRSGLNELQIEGTVYTYGEQNITGLKRLSAGAYVPTPTHPSGAVNLAYLTGNFNVSNTVLLTGNQSISGTKTFLQSPVVPVALASNQAINKSQFDAGLANVAVGTGSIQGVTNVNGISGSVVVDGAGGISVLVCSGVLYVSGNAQNTNFYSVSIPLASGVTGISFSYDPVFSIKPNVIGGLEYSGSAPLQFIQNTLYASNSSGFNVAFSTGIPSSGYFYNINAVPVSGGSGLLGLQGERGFPAPAFKQRGQWGAGKVYQPYDVVFTTPNFVSYWTTGTAISDSFNGPSGTGTSLWQMLASGNQGATGFYIYKGVHSTGSIYNFKESVTFDGSSYVYTGTSPVSGFTPEALTGGWGLVAAKAPLGYFINSGTITGNFQAMSFFLSPASTTGLDLYEVISPSTFFCTGFAIMASTTGAGPQNGGILSGRLYTKDLTNTKTIFQQFTFNSGVVSYISGNFSQPITGFHRVGIDIRNTLSGIDKVSIGVFGFGT